MLAQSSRQSPRWVNERHSTWPHSALPSRLWWCLAGIRAILYFGYGLNVADPLIRQGVMSEADERPTSHTVDFIPKGAENFVFLENQVLDSLVSSVLELSAEVWTLKRRSLFTEALLESKGLVTKHDIETYSPSAEETAEWAAQRDRFVRRIYAPFGRKAPLEKPATPDQFLDR